MSLNGYIVVDKSDDEPLSKILHQDYEDAAQERSGKSCPNDFKIISLSSDSKQKVEETAYLDFRQIIIELERLFANEREVLQEVIEKYFNVTAEPLGDYNAFLVKKKDGYRNHFYDYGLCDPSQSKDPYNLEEDEEE